MRTYLREEIVAIYSEYARVYDQSGQYSFSLKMLSYIQAILDRHPVDGPKVLLDVACGTGTFAMEMADRGWQVVGLDASEAMLEQARLKAAARQLDAAWLRADLREFTIREPVGLVTCLYDSMNYMLTADDLLNAFRRAYAALRPGGLFAFDMNTSWAFESVWNDATYFTDSDDLSVVMQSQFDPQRRRAYVTVTCFERNGTDTDGNSLNSYRKLQERHVEQAFPTEQVATHLVDAGFRFEAQYECFAYTAPGPTTARIMYIARKPR